MSDGLTEHPFGGDSGHAIRLRAVTADEPNRTIRVRAIGELRLSGPGFVLGARDFGGVKPKQLFELLLLAQGSAVPKARLAEALWPNGEPRNVSATLETYVSLLRRRIGRDVVVTEHEAYRLNREFIDCDLDRFAALVAAAEGRSAESALPRLEEALALVDGELLADEPYAEWASSQRVELRLRVLDARLDAAALSIQAKHYRAGLAHAEVARRMDPLDERALRLLMISHYAIGRQCQALAEYESFRKTLLDDLGVDPSTVTSQLHVRILCHESIDTLLPRRVAEGVDTPHPSVIDLVSTSTPVDSTAFQTLLAACTIAKATGGLDGLHALLTQAELLTSALTSSNVASARRLEVQARETGSVVALRSLLESQREVHEAQFASHAAGH